MFGFAVAVDANRGAAAHFWSDEDGVLQVLSAPFFIHDGQAGLDGVDDLGWEDLGQVGRCCSTGVGAIVFFRGGGGFTFEEVVSGLDGGVVIAAGDFEGDAFVFALEFHSGEWVCAAEFFGLQGDHQSAVGVGGVVSRFAHSIGAEHTWFGDAGDDDASGAHAEGVEVSFVRGGGQGVVGGAEEIEVAVFAVFVMVDLFLRVFDADAELERFLNEGDALFIERFVGVAGAVTDAEDDLVGFDEAV